MVVHCAPLCVAYERSKGTQICHLHNFFLLGFSILSGCHDQLHFPLVCFLLCQLFVMAIVVMLVLFIVMSHVAQGGTRM
jgi:hypothetical protein